MSENSIEIIVYIQAIYMLVSGTLLIASERIGGMLVAISFVIQAATLDNPILFRYNTNLREEAWQNLYKDITIIFAVLLISAHPRQSMQHRVEKHDSYKTESRRSSQRSQLSQRSQHSQRGQDIQA